MSWHPIDFDDPATLPPMAPEGTIDHELGRTVEVLVLAKRANAAPEIFKGFYRHDEEPLWCEWQQSGRDGYYIEGAILAWHPLPELPTICPCGRSLSIGSPSTNCCAACLKGA